MVMSWTTTIGLFVAVSGFSSVLPRSHPSRSAACGAAVKGAAVSAAASGAVGDVIGADNAALFDAGTLALLETLHGLGQAHLFADWPEAGVEDDGKRRLGAALARADAAYAGGLAAYVTKARALLEAAGRGDNPFEGFAPSVPDGETLEYGSAAHGAAEAAGLEAAARTGFVLVAGGLGERLGYDGIKLELPVELATGTSFLGLYVEFVLAVQDRARSAGGDASLVVPLAIMTSDDTDAPTRALLADASNFGAADGQVTIVKQDKVAALADADASLALDGDDRWELLTKPHGHGDVHSLMRTSGLARKWKESMGKEYAFFFQDTNPLVLHTILPALGVSAQRAFAMNSVCVPRRAGEAAGAITKLEATDGDPSKDLVINVEYNQLAPLLEAATGKGDENDPATGFSPFPGNANVLVVGLGDYAKTLDGRDMGVVDEFVNPKYKDAAKCAFKKPTRLECMMQDLPKLLKREVPGAKVGFTTFERWCAFSPAKNDLAAARASFAAGEPPGAAGSAEFEYYAAHATRLGLAAKGEHVSKKTRELSGVGGLFGGPRVVLAPSFALTRAEVEAKVVPGGLDLDDDAVLVVHGANIRIESAKVKGAVTLVNDRADATLVVRGLDVANAGVDFVEIPDADIPAAAPFERIRGYKAVNKDALRIEITEPGHFLLEKNGALTKLADRAEL